MPLLWYEAIWDFFLLDLLITHHLLKLGPTSGEWSAFALPRPEMREHLRGTVNALLVPLPTTLWQRVSKCQNSQSLISTTKCRDETNDSTEIGSSRCSRRAGWNSVNFMPTIQWISALWVDWLTGRCLCWGRRGWWRGRRGWRWTAPGSRSRRRSRGSSSGPSPFQEEGSGVMTASEGPMC